MRREGHDVLYVAEIDPAISDAAVLELAINTESIIITEDRDFGELIFRERRYTLGIILIRLHGLSAESKAEMVLSLVREHTGELAGNMVVITPSGVRIRGMNQ